MASSECCSRPRSVMVVGLGNTLLSDEGIGVHVIEALQAMEPGFEENISVRFIDAGTSPDILLSVDAMDKLIIVDAADGGCDPGSVYRFRLEDVSLDRTRVHSLHQVNLPHTLWAMQLMGTMPSDVVVFGIQPEKMDLGLEPSAQLLEKIPEIAKLVLEEAKIC